MNLLRNKTTEQIFLKDFKAKNIYILIPVILNAPIFWKYSTFTVKLVIPLKQKLSGTSDTALSGTSNI